MSDKDFINNKLQLMKKDKQTVFDGFVGPLQEMAQDGTLTKKIQIPADGRWFSVSFDAVEVKKNRLVITAKRIQDGLEPHPHNPTEKLYIVNFDNTRAAYLRGYHKQHRQYGWSYIGWDIRSYANSSHDPGARVYVQGFYAHEEIRKLILAMERVYGTSHILNSYINDNLKRIQAGIKAGQTLEEIEKTWSRGLMESLGYRHVEAVKSGNPPGSWQDASVHWCKNRNDLCGE